MFQDVPPSSVPFPLDCWWTTEDWYQTSTLFERVLNPDPAFFHFTQKHVGGNVSFLQDAAALRDCAGRQHLQDNRSAVVLIIALMSVLES